MLPTELALQHPELVLRIRAAGQGQPLAELPRKLATDWVFAVAKLDKNISLERAFQNYLESAKACKEKSHNLRCSFYYLADKRA